MSQGQTYTDTFTPYRHKLLEAKC